VHGERPHERLWLALEYFHHEKNHAMNSSTVVAAIGLALCAPAPLHAQDGSPEAGKQKTQMCAGCHGIPGYRTAYPVVYSVPKLGGQDLGYIVKALRDYRSGARKHPSMDAVTESLSDQDIADLAAHSFVSWRDGIWRWLMSLPRRQGRWKEDGERILAFLATAPEERGAAAIR
jgi:cytochrome c553